MTDSVFPADAWCPAEPDNTTLLVLCGGRGTRMGGVDKPLLTWRGRMLVEHVLDSVPADMPRLISANRNQALYQRFAPVAHDAPVLADTAIQPGPLVGVLSAWWRVNRDLAPDPSGTGSGAYVTTPWLLVSPGDTPALAPDWWATMMHSANVQGCSAVVAHDGTRQQHLHLLLHRNVAESLQLYLRSGASAVFRWLSSLDTARAEFTDAEQFRNMNRPDDLA